ncbi:MAG: metalloregulator ArsR/SmtB family transcription factor [Acidimicrobiia bacterium]
MVERPEVLDRTYRALAQASRRSMLDMLRSGPLRVTDVAKPFAVSLAAVSKHLGVLESAGLVTRSVVGRDHLLSLEPGPLVEAGDWIDVYRDFWEERLDALELHLRERR